MRTIILPVGPPGSGKSTLCNGLQQFMNATNRPCSAANLDPANENIPYDAAFDVRELVDANDVMDREELGPNGGILWAMEEVEANFDWLEERMGECGMFTVFTSESREVIFGIEVLTSIVRGDDTARSAWTAGTYDTSHGFAPNT